jgi:hypothetical protein
VSRSRPSSVVTRSTSRGRQPQAQQPTRSSSHSPAFRVNNPQAQPRTSSNTGGGVGGVGGGGGGGGRGIGERARSLQRRPIGPQRDLGGHYRFANSSWRGSRFVRDRGFFRGYGPGFWGLRPWYLDWYNARYYLPFVFWTSFVPLPIALSINTTSQQSLESYIIQRENEERAAGRAPADPNARLVPDFTQDPPVLMWAAPAPDL